jgi:hypothetical protein
MIPSYQSILKGIILGTGTTKYDFEKGDYLNYQLKNKILDVIDTAYVEEQGVKEVVEKAPEIMRKVRYIEEKEIMQKFLTKSPRHRHDNMAKPRETTPVRCGRKVLMSKIGLVRVTVNAVHAAEEQHTVKGKQTADFEKGLLGNLVQPAKPHP